MTDYTETPHFCEFCLAKNELRDELQKRGTSIDLCPICKNEGGRALPADDPTARRIFRALVRLYFSEWDYNHHIGGDSLQALVFESKFIFDLPIHASELDFEEAYLLLEGEGCNRPTTILGAIPKDFA